MTGCWKVFCLNVSWYGKKLKYNARKLGCNVLYWLVIINKETRKQKKMLLKENIMDAWARYTLEYTSLKSLEYVKNKYFDYAKNRKTNKVVYTCITGGYDFLNHHKYVDKDWDYICFCDDTEMLKHEYIGAWKIKPLAFDKFDNVRNARWHKTHPHEILKEYEYSIWCDGNVNFLSKHGIKRAEGFIKNGDLIAVPRHFERDCIYDEVEACIICKKDDAALMQKQAGLLREKGFPPHWGLHETNVIFRQHNDSVCTDLMEEWWKWIRDVSRRDQLSFDFVLWNNNLDIPDFCEKPIKHMPEHFCFIYMLNVHTFKM